MRDMRLFGNRKVGETISEKREKYVQKEEIETEIENIENEFKIKEEELNGITQKIFTVKEEYNIIVTNLMLVKKELNQKKMGLDIVQLEYKKIKEKIINSEQIKGSKSIKEFNKTEENLSKIKQKLEEITEEYNQIKKQVSQEQSSIHNIRKQQIEYEKELDEARSRLYNAKEELERKDHFEDTNILTSKERKFIQGESSNQKNSAGIIEAASTVVGSLKSKLNIAQKELEVIQLLLKKERDEHEKTKQKLEKLKTST